MAGTLTIHSNGNGNLLSGHSWIEYQRDGEAASTTFGTFGNDPTGQGKNGLFENIELGETGEASRKVFIDDEQEKQLFSTIQKYKDKGDDGWSKLNPCSGFAAEAWESATREKLADRWWGISNPSKLKESIINANAAQPKTSKPVIRRSSSRGSLSTRGKRGHKIRPTGSRRKIREACEPCRARAR